MAEVTVSYSPKVQGWPSFYSFIPEQMVSLENRFYSLKNGSLWRHNAEGVYSTFYGVAYDHSVELVFNDDPTLNFLYKTLKIEGDDPQDVTVESDIETFGSIDKEWFNKQEGTWFAFIRTSGTTPIGTDEYALRSLSGIATSSGISGSLGARIVNFELAINIGSQLSIGDSFYYLNGGSPVYAGIVTNIEIDKKNAINRVTINDNASGATSPPSGTLYYMYAKNTVAESSGILGHYAKVKLTNQITDRLSEIFSVEAEVMRSFT